MQYKRREYDKTNRNPDLSGIMEKIRHFCGYRERSEKETELRLRSMQVPYGKIRGILDQLKEDGFISDERFARAFVRGKWRVNHWGKIKITYELRAKRIPDKLIVSALGEINQDSYREILEEMIVKKANDIRPQKKTENNSKKSLNIRDKIFIFALGKGYESDLIREILNELKI